MDKSPEALNANRLEALKEDLPEWKVDGQHIERWLGFPNFPTAMRFVHQVAEIAEQLNHHPDIDIRYTRVRISLTTHSAGRLTNLDLEAAARISLLQTGPLQT